MPPGQLSLFAYSSKRILHIRWLWDCMMGPKPSWSYILFSNPLKLKILELRLRLKILKYSQKFNRKMIYIKSNTSLNFFWPQLWWMTSSKKTQLFCSFQLRMICVYIIKVLSIRYKIIKLSNFWLWKTTNTYW